MNWWLRQGADTLLSIGYVCCLMQYNSVHGKCPDTITSNSTTGLIDTV